MTAGTAARRGPDLRRLPLPYLVAAAVAPVLGLAMLGTVLAIARPAPSPTAVGAVAPPFALADLDGHPIRLADLRGRPVIVNFWASWCGPCVEEFPVLRGALEDHRDDRLAVVGIVYRDGSEAARDFIERNAGTWPAAMDPGERVARDYAIVGPPETYFIDRDGRVAARQIGQLTAGSLEAHLAAIIEE